MSRTIRVLAAAAVVYALAATSAFGQIISFDENGNGMGPTGPLPHTIAVDPISGIATLVYTLPVAVAPGDLLLFEQQTSTLSDIVRFNGTNQAFFFSDHETGDALDLADVGLPTPITPNTPMNENGPEGNNGVVYIPVAGGPGSGIQQYNITSDIVPEPSTALLAGMGGALLLFVRRRR
jgi:hypothetical protein